MPWIKVKLETVDKLAAISLIEGNTFRSCARPVPRDPDHVYIPLTNDVFLEITSRAAREGVSEDEIISRMVEAYRR